MRDPSETRRCERADAGLVADDGRIIHGKGFTIQHLNTGHY